MTATGEPPRVTARPDAGGGPVARLDLRGLHCPMPVLLTRKTLRSLRAGDALVVECTDPLSTIDIPHFARSAGHDVADVTHADGVIAFRIVKGGERRPAAPTLAWS